MEEQMSLPKDLVDIIVTFISKRKKSALERAFRKNAKLLDAIRRLDTSYSNMEKILSDHCQKYPESCKSWEERDKKNLDL